MPPVADAIMESDDYAFTHYDKQKVAQLCERAQLFQRALDHYTSIDDIKRVLTNTHMLNPEFLLDFFGRLSKENGLDCLRDILKYNLQQNIRLVVEIAKKWSDYLGADNLVALFEEFKSYNGIYFYLGATINFTEDSGVVFKYIEAAVKLTQLKEVERVCRDNDHYNAEQVKAFLLEQNLKDPRPLIHVCDRYGFVPELTRHLYSNNMYMFIEAYVQRMNSKATPKVLGTLIELNATEEQLKKLLSAVRAPPPPEDSAFFEELVNEVEHRNRLKILKPFLEARRDEGLEDAHLHNGLAKIAIDTNSSPAAFLEKNQFYDSDVVGKYCEARDPHLSFIAYKRAGGACDDALINITNNNGFFKDQAKYCVKRQDLELWAKVLDTENQHRRALVDQVVATALPEAKDAEEVSTTVKAFMAANLPSELIELLERIILHGPSDGEFRTNRNLQNLLILTAIKADSKRVMDYVNRLDNYDGPDIAKIAASEQYGLYEEAFFIYKKSKEGADAITVLLDNLHAIPRAVEYAAYVDEKPVWSLLGKAQLAGEGDGAGVVAAIDSFIKADDASDFLSVIAAAKAGSHLDELVTFLTMARSKIKDAALDNEVIFCFAHSGRLSDLEEFITGPNVAKINDVGDDCFVNTLYEAAKILYAHVNDWAKLALTHLKLTSWSDAVEAARKANSTQTWRHVAFACVDAADFRLAQMAAVNVVVFADQLDAVVSHYEVNGHFNELMTLLEQAANLERAPQGIFTQLGVQYARHKEEKLMEHCKLYWSRLNIRELLRVCEENLHWSEVVFLYSHYDQFDNGVDVMIAHSAECWTHNLFMEVLKQVANTEVYYRALRFYMDQHPSNLIALLTDLSPKLDHSRVISIVTSAGHLPLIEKYLLNIQPQNLSAVNDALNRMYVDAEDSTALRKSIETYDAFDQIALATELDGSTLLEFRRIAAALYMQNKRFDRSIELSKQDGLWDDAMAATARSGNPELCEQLLTHFVTEGQNDCFAACLYTCYSLVAPDVVLELAWRNNLMTHAMPYFIQRFRTYDDELAAIKARFAAEDAAKAAVAAAADAADAEQNANDAAYVGVGNGPYNPMMAPLALAAPPSFAATPQYNPQQMYDAPQGAPQPGFY
jgi:clathrin heavy chain